MKQNKSLLNIQAYFRNESYENYIKSTLICIHPNSISFTQPTVNNTNTIIQRFLIRAGLTPYNET